MSELAAATERLTAAVDRLETAAGARLLNAQLLSAELKRERSEHFHLEAAADGVSSRLESVISRLKSALDE